MQCSFKVPQAYRSPTGFSFNFFAALKIPLSSRKKWCFQKQALNLKTCYVLHCRRMQRCWALWTLSRWHKYIFIISQLQNVQITHVQVLKGEKCTAYHILMTGSICNHYKKVMSSRCNGFSWKNTSNLKRVVAFSLLLGVKFAPLIMISIEINLKDGDSQIGGWLKTGSLQPVCFWRLDSCREPLIGGSRSTD